MYKLLFLLLIYNISFSQITINGVVLDSKTKKGLSDVIVTDLKTSEKKVTNSKGEFKFLFSDTRRVSLNISAIGYINTIVNLKANENNIIVLLTEEATNLSEVTLVSDKHKKIVESPFSLIVVNSADIEKTTSPDFYKALENEKGINLNTNSLTFKSVNTRGFATFENNRFIQLVDGIDNASPGLGFTFGNALGLNELDVQSITVLPGASSAIYGANAFNGVLETVSKNPFDYQGTSVYVKPGVTVSNNAGVNEFIDVGFRFAKKISDRFALKLTGSFIKGTDWQATDDRNIDAQGNVIKGDRGSDPGYNGINFYGDIVATNLDGVGVVSRTGYAEQELADSSTENFKSTLSFHYKPLGEKKVDEIILSGVLGTGSTTFQGASRNALDGYINFQPKITYKNKHLTTSVYSTLGSTGDSYDIRFAGINLNRAAKSDIDWFTDYSLAFNGVLLNPAFGGVFEGLAPEQQSHAAARAFADNNLLNTNSLNANQQGALNSVISSITGGAVNIWQRTDSQRLVSGTSEFNEALDAIKRETNTASGAKLLNNSRLHHGQIKYEFKDKIKFANIQLGGSLRSYTLDSDGTFFNDSADDNINYTEQGAYGQIQKKLLNNSLNLSGTIRYDESKSFKGNISSVLSGVYVIDAAKKQVLRASYKTGFRNPSSAEQYLGFNVGSSIIIGAAKDNLDRSLSSSNLTLRDVLEATGFSTLKQEKVISYELGYRLSLTGFTIDASSYVNSYKNFISIRTVQVENQNFDLYTNTNADINSYGTDIGVTKKVFKNFDVKLNYSFAKFEFNQEEDPDLETRFNTPEHTVKLTISNPNIYKGIGFGFNTRWQDAYEWESAFVDDTIGARFVVDASLNYYYSKLNSKIKIGGVNILQNEYVSAPGSGTIGGQYFVSWICDF